VDQIEGFIILNGYENIGTNIYILLKKIKGLEDEEEDTLAKKNTRH